MKQSSPSTGKAVVKKQRRGNPLRWAYELLFHEDVYRRIGGFLLWGFVFLGVSWAIGFFLIKEPIFKDTLMVDKIFGIAGIRDTFGNWGVRWLGTEFRFLNFGPGLKLSMMEHNTMEVFNVWGNVLFVMLKVFAHNLIIALVFILGLNLFRIKRFPLGYFFFGLFTLLTGLVVGTNAYTFPPQWAKQIGAVVTFARFGLWQWFALGLLAVSTLKWGWISSSSLLKPEWSKIRSSIWPVQFGNRDNVEVFVYGLLFLLAASFAEARLIVHYAYHMIFS